MDCCCKEFNGGSASMSHGLVVAERGSFKNRLLVSVLHCKTEVNRITI